MMNFSADQLVQQIHDTPTRIVLAITGGGSRAVSDLLEVPGASRTLLDAQIPYSSEAIIAFLGARPDEFCSDRTARALAMAAFLRARKLHQPDDLLAGLSCTAALATDRPRHGSHRAHLALQTASLTVTWSLELLKDRRSRAEEERLVSRLLLNAIAEACGTANRLTLDLLEGEHVEQISTMAEQPWQDLLLGKIEVTCTCGKPPAPSAIFSGAFNPLHQGHRRMMDLAAEILKRPVAMEISILNVDKPPLDYFEIHRRLSQFPPEQPVILSRAATFDEKSRLFPGATFVVGSDTLRRIALPSYYAGDKAACFSALQRIANRGCKFLVFGRDMGTGFVRLADLDLPDSLRNISREVSPEVFRENISSTGLRKSGAW
jgi:nicotinamide mononucleotide (NMN) deamidase PncC